MRSKATARAKCLADGSAIFRHPFKIDNQYDSQSIQIGAQSLCMGQLAVQRKGARIEIGEWCYVGPDSKIWAMSHIMIGNRVFVSHGVHILDNNSHSLDPHARHDMFVDLVRFPLKGRVEVVSSKPVRLEDDVWVGFNAAILKGVTIGRGAVVGAMSVVTKDVPPGAVVVGNPARLVRQCPS